MYLSLTDDSSHSDTDGKKNSDEDDDDDDDDDDDGQDSDASGPISSYLEDAPGGCFVTGKGEGINSGSLPNDNYLLSEHKHCSEDLEARDSDTEGSILDDEVSAERCQEQSINSLQSKCCDSKKGMCNATFVIDKSETFPSMTRPELSHAFVYKKPVSVVHPITSSVVKKSAKTSFSKEDQVNSIETSGKLDLVQAVLCSRNKIALALAEIVEGKQPSVVSDDSTCPTDRESEVTSSREESCSTYARRLGSYCRFRELGIGKKDGCDLMGEEQTKASVIRGSNNALVNQESKVLDSETHQPSCSNADKQHRLVRHRSLKIASSSLDRETKSSSRSVKLENGNCDMPQVNSSPSKKRSAILCKFSGPKKCKEKLEYRKRCSADSPIMSPSSKALGITLGHQRSVTVCNLEGPVPCNGQGKYLERCPGDSLIMCPGSKALGTSSGHQRSATSCNLGGLVTCNGQGKYLERCSEDSQSMSPGSEALGTPSGHQTTPLVPSSISPGLQSSSSNSKRKRSSQVLKVFNDTAAKESWSSVEKKAARLKHRGACTHFEKCDNLPKTCRSTAKLTSSTLSPDGPTRENFSKRSLFLSIVTADLASSYQKSNGEEVCKERQESSSSAVKNRRDQKLSCSNTYSDLVNAQSREKFPPLSIALRKNSCDNHGYVFDRQDESAALNVENETAEEQTVDKLNCGRNLLVSGLLRTRADKEHLSAADRAGVQSKERVMKSSKQHASSPGGSSRNSYFRTGLGSDTSPLNARKKRARESFAIDTLDSLPSKHAKRSSSCSSHLERCPFQSSALSQALNCYRKESTPMKKTNLESLRLEAFLRQNTKPLSPIRPTPADPHGSGNNAVMSPCKTLGSCDKSFCFDCC